MNFFRRTDHFEFGNYGSVYWKSFLNANTRHNGTDRKSRAGFFAVLPGNDYPLKRSGAFENFDLGTWLYLAFNFFFDHVRLRYIDANIRMNTNYTNGGFLFFDA